MGIRNRYQAILGPEAVKNRQDEVNANITAQIAIASCALLYIGLLVAVLTGVTRYTIREYAIMLLFFLAAVGAVMLTYNWCRRHCDYVIKYLMMGVLFMAGISLEGYTRMMMPLLLSFPIMLACRYHNRRFLNHVIVCSFLSILLKEFVGWAIGMYDLNVVSILNNTLIENGREFQSGVMPYVDMTYYLNDVIVFAVLPECVQLMVITVLAILLGKNGRSLRAHQLQSIRREAAVEREMENAREIQMGLLPDEFDFAAGVELYASSRPAKNVGGDFYDCFMADERHLAIVIADVSGKGMPASLFMATTKMSIRDHVAVSAEPADIFTRVNAAVCVGNRMGLFVTAWLGLLDLESGQLRYVNAGHNPPLVRRGDGAYEYLAMKKNLVLGAFDTYRYKSEELTLAPGDRLVLYTDGVTESRNPAGELMGEERLASFLNARTAANSRETVDQINAEVDRYAAGEDQYDDVTVLALRFEGRAAAE